MELPPPCIPCPVMRKHGCQLQGVCRKVQQHKERLVNNGIPEHRNQVYLKWYRTHERNK